MLEYLGTQSIDGTIDVSALIDYGNPIMLFSLRSQSWPVSDSASVAFSGDHL